MNNRSALRKLERSIITCCRCPRLVQWRQTVARTKVKRFSNEEYWGKPVPGFGNPDARLLIVGLAPGAHGANRTGRMFTGDNSGLWLYRALHKAGFASQPDSHHIGDGLQLVDCYITAALRCVPPRNKPLPHEAQRCAPFLLKEIELLTRVRVVVGLGRIGFEAALRGYRDHGRVAFTRKPQFGHGVVYTLGDLTFIGSFHPSQQNTFTGRLTRRMLDDVFERAREVLRF